jgi:ribonuclease E
MKRMLINATQPEELRVALVDGQSIYDFDIEQVGQERKKSNIYKARVSRIEQSLGAAFVDFGSERHGFLPVKELNPGLYKGKDAKTPINEVLTQGQEIIVQVEKEERGNKGAALSTFISLPGHYLVLMPNSPEAGGISKSIEGKARDEIREKLKQLNIPKEMGLIVRTAGDGVSLEELKWDLDYLLNLWDAILEANQLRKAPFLIFRENDLISRSLRDFLRDDITEVLVDTDEAFEKAHDFTSKLMPDFEEKIKKYDEAIPLFTRYQIESQIETAYQREVSLPSGGSIVIDQTEALVAIDINSAKATGGSDIEETALNTNLESAVEIGKQLRLRDIGGLVVIDFIDMLSLKNKRAVEDKLWSALSIDRAKVQVGRISRFGLMEMSRQRLRPSLQERWTQDVASLSTAVLRLIEEEASKKKSGEVRAIVSSDMSTFLLNERRARVNEIEERTSVRVIVVSDPTRSDNRFEVTRLRSDDKKNKDHASYDIQSEIESNGSVSTDYKKPKLEKPAVSLTPPKKPKKKGEGIFKKFLKLFNSSEDDKSKNKHKRRNTRNRKRPENRNRKPQQRNATRNNNKPKNDRTSEKKKPANNKSKTNTEKRDNNRPEKKADNRKKQNDQTKTNEVKKTAPKRNVQKKIKEEKSSKPPKKDEHVKTESEKPEIKEPKKVPQNKKELSETKDNKVTSNESPKENKEKEATKLVKESNKAATKESPKEEIIKEEKKAKDWGRASNDPRNKG